MIWILNDLYVDEKYRRLGIARELLGKAEQFARETGAKGLSLETTPDNFNAQKLYEILGWEREDGFLHYSLIVNK